MTERDGPVGADTRVHPYIPNAVPEVKAAMLAAVGATSTEDFYVDVPESIRLRRPLDLPPPLRSEVELVRHVEGLLNRNTSTRDALSFLGAGCYQHHVPAVCDEINGRGEFLTAYAGDPYEDHGRFQALFEYESLMAELLERDVVNVPTYDGFQAAGTAIRMAARVTGRRRALVPASMSRDKRSKIVDYVRPAVAVELVPTDPRTGTLDLRALEAALGPDVACVLVENPSFLGTIETGGPEIVRLAHASGALAVVSVDPSMLGVLNPPAAWGADIDCGDIQPLGIHQHWGGGHGGFIASDDDPRIVLEYPSRLFGIAPTSVPGEYGFGDVAYERTSFALREEGKEWVGTAAALWGITAGVYLALMGPQGMRELGSTIMANVRYTMTRLAEIPGVRLPYAASPHAKEFVLDLAGAGATPAAIAAILRDRGIFLGYDLASEAPERAGQVLVAVTEVHLRADIDRLVDELGAAVRAGASR
jgi:glycine cleavage system P protein (glycine dehydrogenase) subunit 1